ncbi:MAG: TraB/GumN family protein [Bacteroidota bacterium]
MEAEEIRVQPVNCLVWEIDRADLKRPSYIYAILHKVSKKDFFLPKDLSSILRQCDKLVMEVDPLTYNMDHQHRGTMPIDSTLDVLLDKRKYQWLRSYVKDSLSDLAYYQLSSRYAPVLLARQAISDYCLDYRPGKEAISYETYLALNAGIPLRVLGTEWTRTAWLDTYNFQEQTDYLLSTIENRSALCEIYMAIVRAYRRQNLDQIWLLAKDSPDVGDNTGKFLEARNFGWMEKLSWQLKKESLFIAVNAVQLPGEFGLIHLLRKKGFEVRPMNLEIPEN